MKGGLGFAAILGAMLGPAIARAEGTSCTDPTIIVPDGRITASTIPPGQTFYFKVSSRVGSSYSAEFHNTLGPGSQTPGTLIVYSDAGCTVSITPASTSSVDPGDDNGVRVAFTATTAQSRFALDNTAGSPITYSFSVSDTTMFSPAWSTNGTFDSFYSFLNTTGGTIRATLTLYNISGTSVATNSFTINPNSTASTNTAALATVRNTTGTARFTHDGPPGAILAEAAIANFTITPTPYFQSVKFVPVRELTR